MRALPDELLFMIFKECRLKDIINLTMVCRRFRGITKSDYFWKHKYLSEYPDLSLTPESFGGSWYKLSLAITGGKIKPIPVIDVRHGYKFMGIIWMEEENRNLSLLNKISPLYTNYGYVAVLDLKGYDEYVDLSISWGDRVTMKRFYDADGKMVSVWTNCTKICRIE